MKHSSTATLDGVVRYTADADTWTNRVSFLPTSERVYPTALRMSAVTRNRQTPSLELYLEFIGKNTGRKIVANALIDSGAEGLIINASFAKSHHFSLLPVPAPFPVRNVDGSENIMGYVTHFTIQRVRIYNHDRSSYHEEEIELYVTDIGDHDVILGSDWLTEHNPEIDWTGYEVHFT